MPKTKEQIKEYNRLKAQESRAKKKALGIPANDPEVTKKASKNYRDKNKGDIVSIIFDKETKELFYSKKPDNQTPSEFLKNLLK
jgi:DNA helicase IV